MRRRIRSEILTIPTETLDALSFCISLLIQLRRTVDIPSPGRNRQEQGHLS
jgi:hypothetical protein